MALTFTIKVFTALFIFAAILIGLFVLLYRQLSKRNLLRGAESLEPDTPPHDVGGKY